MATADKAAALVRLERARARLEELQLRVLATASEVAEEAGARDVGVWLAHQVQAEPARTAGDLRLAAALDSRWQKVAAGMRTGRVSRAQAAVIADALAELPDSVGAQTVASAEETLVGFAEAHRPSELRRLGRRILGVVAPEIAEAEEAQRLLAEEQAAREAARLRFRPRGDGTTAYPGVMPDADAHRWRSYLEAFTSPRHPEGAPGVQEGDKIPTRRKLAHAFSALLEHLDPARLPEHGGDATTILVTIPLAQLRHDLGTAELLGTRTGGDLSAAQVRRLACTATIIPAVLGGKGEVLDLGRRRRLFTRAQRRAARLRDPGCAAEGCDVPAAWTEAHHDDPWSHGGPTDLAKLRHYCSHHHHLAHDPRYTHQTLPNGRVRFHRRP